MSYKILVIGGTGMLGRPVVEQLRKDNFDVSVMTTNIEKANRIFGNEVRIVMGDVTDEESLKRNLDGFDFVHINLNAQLDPEKYERIEINGTVNVARVSKNVGIKRISMISGASSKGVEKGIIYLDSKVRAEKALMNSGVAYSIMRPSWFFESLPLSIQQGKAVVIGKQPLKIGWLAASDYARQVSHAFQNEKAANKCFYNLGPEKMTMMEALEKYCAVCHPDLKPEVISFSKAKFFANILGIKELKAVIPFFEYFSEVDEDVDPSEANNILGSNMTTIDKWLEEYKK